MNLSTKCVYKSKVKVRSPDGHTEYFDIVAGVLQGDTLAPHPFIIYLDYVLRTSIDKIRENGFELKKKKSRRYHAKTITNADYADDIALLANIPNQAVSILLYGCTTCTLTKRLEKKLNGNYTRILNKS